jgi:hypothetical protein
MVGRKAGHTSPYEGKVTLRMWQHGATGAQTQWINEFVSEGRGQPVGPTRYFI